MIEIIYKIQTENYLLVTFYDNLLNEIPVPEFIECEGFSNRNSVIKNTLSDTNSFLILYPANNKYNINVDTIAFKPITTLDQIYTYFIDPANVLFSRCNIVVKEYLFDQNNLDRYKVAVLTTLVSQYFANQFNNTRSELENFLKFNSNNVWQNPDEKCKMLEAFTHFSYKYSNYQLVICDLQGDLYSYNYELTDAAINSQTGLFGFTDRGLVGMQNVLNIIQDYEKRIYDLESENQFLKERNNYLNDLNQYHINLFINAYYYFDYQHFEHEVVNYVDEVNVMKENEVIVIDEENVKKEETEEGSLKFDRQSIISLSDDDSTACSCIEYGGSCEDCFIKKFKSEYDSEDNFNYDNYNEAYYNVFNDDEREYNENYHIANTNNFNYKENESDDGYEAFLQKREYNSYDKYLEDKNIQNFEYYMSQHSQ
ncbi:17393_t:CDS:2, partial [Cetraspora pellucida]